MEGACVFVPVTNGEPFFVDVEDWNVVRNESWHRADQRGSVVGLTGQVTGKHLSRLINKTPEGFDTDHINGDLCDYTRKNLRTATRSQNMANRGKTKRSGNTSKYKGVFWSRHASKWTAQIQVDYHRKNLGYFMSEEDAAKAYNQAAIMYFGRFAKVNDLGQHS